MLKIKPFMDEDTSIHDSIIKNNQDSKTNDLMLCAIVPDRCLGIHPVYDAWDLKNDPTVQRHQQTNLQGGRIYKGVKKKTILLSIDLSRNVFSRSFNPISIVPSLTD